jgi:hypothetical protein
MPSRIRYSEHTQAMVENTWLGLEFRGDLLVQGRHIYDDPSL